MEAQTQTSPCLYMAPLGAGVTLQALVGAVHVPPAHPTPGVLLALGGGTSVILGVRRSLVIRH